MRRKKQGQKRRAKPSPESSPEFTEGDANIISEGIREASAIYPNKNEKVEDVEDLFHVKERQKGPHEHVH